MTLESIPQLSYTPVHYILEPAIRSGGLVVAVSLLFFAIRLREASAKLIIWKLVLFAALAMPLLPALLPALSFSLLQPEAPATLQTPIATQIATETMPAGDRLASVDPGAATLAHNQVSKSMDWGKVATTLYVLIAAMMLVRLVVGLFLSRRLCRAAQPITDSRATAIVREVAIGRMRIPMLAESQAVTVPITLSVGRSTILLPVDWRRWEVQKLRAVLAHEMAHVARRDAVVQMLSALHRCFFWFSPASWWLHRRIVETAEQAADSRALEVVSDRTFYAEVLLDFFKALKAAPGRLWSIEVSMARGSAAERRVDGVLREGRVLRRGIRRAVVIGAFLVMLPLVYVAAALRPAEPEAVTVTTQPVASSQNYPRMTPETDLALAILLPNDSNARTVRVSTGRTMTTVDRNRLKVIDSRAAADLTGLDVWADREGDSIRLRLSVLYNDLSKSDWWKNKKEKVLDSLVIRKGESVRPAELAEFGIEPIEFKAMSAELRVFKPGEGPRINNNTRSLEVVNLEKSLDTYYLTLRNTSDKNVISFVVNCAGTPGRLVGFFSGSEPTIAAGGDFSRLDFFARSVDEAGGLTIANVVFEDRTFEGDAFLAACFLAQNDGARVAVPGVLHLVDEALKADDSGLERAVDKLEARLRAMPESIAQGKSFAEFRATFGPFDEKTLMLAYKIYLGSGPELLSAGILESIQALRHNIKSPVNEGQPSQFDPNWKAQRIRQMLTALKEHLGQLAPSR